MTDKCKLPDCNNKLVHTEGRRPKEFCSPKCRTLFHNLKKVKGVGRGRPKGSKNKDKLEVKVIDPQPIPKVIITDNSMTVTNDMTLDEIREKFGNEAAEKARLVMQQEIGMYISPTQPDKYGNPKQDSSGVNEDEVRGGIDPCNIDNSTSIVVISKNSETKKSKDPIVVYHSNKDDQTDIGEVVDEISKHYHTPVFKESEGMGCKIEFVNATPESYNGKDEDRFKFDEVALFDFSQDVFLNIEKHTKYPKKDRPTNKGEAITWDNLKKESDQRIKEAWAKYKAKQ